MGDFVDLFLTADILTDFFQFGDSHCQKLNDDACVDICRYANGEYCALGQRSARNEVVVVEHRCAAKHRRERRRIDERNRHTAAKTVNQQAQDGKENLTANIIHHQLLEDVAVRVRLFDSRLFSLEFGIIQNLLPFSA